MRRGEDLPYRHFDPTAMVEDFMNSPAVVKTVLEQFIDWQKDVSADLRSALDMEDRSRLRILAHSLRGTMAQLHAPAGTRFASAIELLCQQNLAVPEDLVDCFFCELDAITRESRRYLESTSP